MRAAVAIPTQRRAAYLEVALASAVPQARAAGAEVLVVDDGPDPETEAAAARHGARYLAHEAPRGLNAARNTALAATDAELVCFVDDDVAVRDGWLDALLRAAEACRDDVAVLTGPIHARFEGHRFRTCGREGPPVTFLDLGPDDRDCDHAWGANMAVRRSAITRAGSFDESRELYGDEQEWQARVKAAGGRIRYVAAAALDHRRAGADATLRALARAAYRRGQASRRFDVFKGTAPSLAGELRVLAGCVAHGPRYACMNGPVLATHSLGRLRAMLGGASARGSLGRLHAMLAGRAPGAAAARRLRAALTTPTTADSAAPDFLSGASGTVAGKRGALLRAHDAWLDVRAAPRRLRLRAGARHHPPRRRVLVLGIERPGSIMPAARTELERSRHDVEVVTVPPGERGKFENLNALLAEHPPDAYDWVLVVDDDVALPRGFLDAFLHLAERAGFALAQPAHRLHSHAAWAITRRHPGAAARETTFVEIGPVTAFGREAVAALLPFPEGLRMGWGLDVHWAAVAAQRGWRIGVVDATPIGHTQQPAASAYPRAEAEAEARAFLRDRPYVTRDEVRTLAVHR